MNSTSLSSRVPVSWFLFALPAVAMAYAWCFRGVVGHESGGMFVGAVLGLSLCLASGRPDWYRRSAVASLFCAVGYAWGGSLTFMEYTFYVSSYSLPTVYYAYAGIFFVGAMWSGLGCGSLGLALTLPRSRLAALVRPFATLCLVYLAAYIFFSFNPDTKRAFELYTAEHWHDGEWFAALLALFASAGHWLVRPKDRREAGLFFACACGWWIGYLALTKFGGIELAPPHRSESWAGVLGIFVVFMVYLHRDKNRAAFAFGAYGALVGGLGYALALLARHPIHVSWGPFAGSEEFMRGKIFEMSYGTILGLGMAIVAAQFIRRGLPSADEDVDRKPLDIVAVFGVLIALNWVNLKNAPLQWINKYGLLPQEPVLGMMPWLWFLIGGGLIAALALRSLDLYRRDALPVAPPTAYGKGSFVLILLLWTSWIGAFTMRLTDPKSDQRLVINAAFVILIATATWLILGHFMKARSAVEPSKAGVSPYDATWLPGRRFALLCAAMPILFFVLAEVSMAMQDGPHKNSHLRFGPNAQWRIETDISGPWIATHIAYDLRDLNMTTDGLPVAAAELRPDFTLALTLPDGSVNETDHRWADSKPYPTIVWNANLPDAEQKGAAPLRLKNGRLYASWPPYSDRSYFLAFERPEGVATSVRSGGDE